MREHIALWKGEISSDRPILVRVHSECLTGDVFGSYRCDCGPQLETALARIEAEGGILVYLRQEGRGIGLYEKLRAYALQERGFDTVDANLVLGHPVDARDYDVAAAILHDLGVRRVRLLTNNPEKVEALRQFGIEVVERVPLEIPAGGEPPLPRGEKAPPGAPALPSVKSRSLPPVEGCIGLRIFCPNRIWSEGGFCVLDHDGTHLSPSEAVLEGRLRGEGLTFALVASRFNEFFVRPLVQGARSALVRHGVRPEDIAEIWVPGSFELPLAAKRLAESGAFSGIVALGVVMRGETAHFDYVAGEASSGLARVAWETGVPVGFALLTLDDAEQAVHRAGARRGTRAPKPPWPRWKWPTSCATFPPLPGSFAGEPELHRMVA